MFSSPMLWLITYATLVLETIITPILLELLLILLYSIILLLAWELWLSFLKPHSSVLSQAKIYIFPLFLYIFVYSIYTNATHLILTLPSLSIEMRVNMKPTRCLKIRVVSSNGFPLKGRFGVNLKKTLLFVCKNRSHNDMFCRKKCFSFCFQFFTFSP